ncbi:YfhO family protein [Clostridium sp. WILCCON 0269]|uniref:YfhO family protein n=1 Tax=Candidatus Clostridium eludens TaxID=3381663 RepID=A0ABW8SHJ8_9CLOT
MKNNTYLFIKQYFDKFINKESGFFNFMRFAVIGVINTIHYYVWYRILLWLQIPYVLSHTIAFIISMIGSYFLNCFFTFRTKPTFRKFISYPLTTLSNYIISTVSLVLLVNLFNIASSVAALLASILPIPITFMVTHHVLKKTDEDTIIEENSKIKLQRNLKNLFAYVFLLMFSIACHLYILYSRVLFGKFDTDSISQFMYFMPFLQKAFSSGEPFWSWSYGLGGDIFGQFSYYYTTSPFFYLSLLLKTLGIGSWTLENTLEFKLLFSIFKQFLAMSICYALLRYEGKKRYSSLIGAMIYGGCICFIWFSLFFDFMADAYIWLPLTILGIRRYEKTGKSLLFILSAALTVGNSFYFGFISFIFYAIFIIVFINIKGTNFKERIYSFLSSVSRYVLFAILALGIAATAFVPSVSAFLKTDRFSNPSITPIFYDSKYILSLPDQLFFYSSILGLPLILLVIFALPWKQLTLITKRKIVLVGIFFVLYLTPYSGSFFNGFSYSVKRWYYLLIFSIAYAVPDWLEENDRLKQIGAYFVSSVTLLALLFYYTRVQRGFDHVIHSKKATNILNISILGAGLISLWMVAFKKYISKKFTNKILSYTVVLCVGTSLMLNSNAYLYLVQPNVSRAILQTQSGMENKEESYIFGKLTPSNSEFYRTLFRNSIMENTPMSYNYYGTSAYNSMIDGNLHKWLKVDHNILYPSVTPSRYENFDDRLFIETAFGVKYLVTYKNDNYTPPNFYQLIEKTKNYNIFENKNNVGFDLWYSNTTGKSSYDEMNVAERDAALLQTAVADKVIPGIKNKSIDSSTSELAIDWKNAYTVNAKYENGVLAAQKGAIVNVPITNTLKGTEGEILFTMNIKPVNGQMIKLTVNGKSTTKMKDTYPYIYPINNFTFRLDDSTKMLKIQISEGKYVISSAHAWFNSYNYYTECVKDLNKYNLENLYVNGGTISGNIKNNEKGILALNIPYSSGWSARVDGKKQQLIKVNVVFTGIVLEPGVHNIKLSYITPGFIPGAIISVIFILGIIIYFTLFI